MSAELTRLRGLDDELPVPEELKGSFAVLRRGVRESPELRAGLGFTLVVSLGITAISLVTPILVQQVFDHGFTPEFKPRFVYGICVLAFLLVIVAFLAARTAGRRLVRASEEALMNLRVRTFAHIHRLSIAEQSEEKRGVFVARVTADADSLQQFTEWGGIAWLISFVQAFAALGVMLVYSWQLSIVVVLLMVPLVVIMGSMQARLSAAFDAARTRVGEMLSEVSESVMGAAVVRAYGLDDTIHARVTGAIGRRYDAEVKAHLRAATLWPMSSVFYALTLAVVIAVGAIFGPEWGLTLGTATAFLFLGDVFLSVFEDLPEIYSETQTAIAGWRKILAVLDLPIEIEEPADGVRLPTHGALDVEVNDLTFGYRERTAGAARHRGVDRGRRPRRDRGRDRQRQDHVREAAHPPRRSSGRLDRGRRRRPARDRPVVTPGRDPHGAPGRLPLRLDGAGERQGRARRGHRPRGRRRLRGARPR